MFQKLLDHLLFLIGSNFCVLQQHTISDAPMNFQAYNLLQELKSKSSTNPSFFVSMSTIESIHKQLNMPLGRGGMDRDELRFGNNQDGDDEIEGEAIEEEVIDEMDD